MQTICRYIACVCQLICSGNRIIYFVAYFAVQEAKSLISYKMNIEKLLDFHARDLYFYTLHISESLIDNPHKIKKIP